MSYLNCLIVKLKLFSVVSYCAIIQKTVFICDRLEGIKGRSDRPALIRNLDTRWCWSPVSWKWCYAVASE
jgi:hypothetical protein